MEVLDSVKKYRFWFNWGKHPSCEAYIEIVNNEFVNIIYYDDRSKVNFFL